MTKPTSQFGYTIQDLTTCPVPSDLFLVLVTVTPDTPDGDDNDGGETNSTVFPVLALRTYIRYHYYASVDRKLTKAPTYEGMLAAGWSFDFQEILTEPLVLEPGGADLVEPGYLAYDYGMWAATKMVQGELDQEELGVLVADASAAIHRHVEFQRANVLEV